MRVFVLSTGRCGSTTFSRACSHMTNYTSGHETRGKLIGAERLAYPDSHIEVDNRLSWFLGKLGETAQPDDFYVWLRRDPDEVAASFLRRWRYNWRGGIIEAFAHAIVMHAADWDPDDRLEVCRFYVDTVESNISSFLEHRSSWMTVQLESAAEDFDRLWSRIGAEGNRRAALAEWDVQYNASRGSDSTVPTPTQGT